MTQNSKLIRNIGLTMAGAVLITACGKKEIDIPIDAQPPTQTTTQNTNNGNGNGAITNAIVPGSQEDFLSQITSDTVFFDTDKFDIDAQDQSTLRSQAQWLLQYPNKNVTIQGHTDERGTRDYNLALGERRANSAKNFLISLGVSSNRINTVSFGKEQPSALGSNERAWSQNRRAVTVTVQ